MNVSPARVAGSSALGCPMRVDRPAASTTAGIGTSLLY
jgi:hypothetical protein